MNMVRNKTIPLVYIYSILAILISYFGLVFAPIALLSALVVPVILSVIMYGYGICNGIYTALSIIVFNSVNTFLFTDNLSFYGLIYSVFTVISGLVIGTNHIKKTSYKTFLICVGTYYTICSLMFFAVVKYLLRFDVTNFVRFYFVESYNMVFEALRVYYPSLLSTIAIPEYELFNTFYCVMPGMVPFMTIMSIIFTTFVQYGICKLLINNYFIKNLNFSDGFEKFKLTFFSAIVFLISFLINSSNINNILSMVSLNVFMIIFMLYIMEAASILYYKLKQSITSRAFRILLFCVIAVFSIAISVFVPVVNIFYIFVFIGLTDSIFDYRKLGENNNENYEE